MQHFVNILAVVIISSQVFVAHSKLTPLKASENYTHVIDVDENNPSQYVLYWKIINDDEIQFEAHCKSTGWIGLGISPNGGMKGSDIAIGWVDSNGKGYLKDCYAYETSTPIVDKKQNWELLDSAEINGYTVLKYKRKLQTCDEENDRPIKIGTDFLIFAWNNEDPKTGKNDWRYHEQNRITRTLMLLNYKNETIDEQNNFPSDTFTHTIRMPNLKVPAKDTYYYCDLFKLPKFSTKTQLLQFEMLVNKKNVKNVHHLLVYECEPDFDYNKPLAQECGSVPLPEIIGRYCMNKLIVAWGIGGQYNYSFPKQAGYPFMPTKAQYLLFEMHYDNPTLASNIVDDSGIKFYLTETLREHDLGVLILGSEGIPMSLTIPPKAKSVVFDTICHPECTQHFIPDDGIYAIGGLLHTHLLGRAVKTALVRNDTLIKYLLNNPNYDFEYQFIQDIRPTKLYKGDALITTCEYDSSNRKNFTFFGFATHDEMCFDFLYYYPRQQNFPFCHSMTPPNILFDFYRLMMTESLMPFRELNEISYFPEMKQTMNYLNTVNFTEAFVTKYTEFLKSPSNKSYYCGMYEVDFIYKDNVEHYSPSKINMETDDDKCKPGNSANNLESINLNISLISILMIGILKCF